MSSSPDDPRVPEGLAFFDALDKAAGRAGASTDAYLESAGTKAPLAKRDLGTLLASLYQAATCAWGCSGGDHQVEWLVGRVVNLAQGAYRLMNAALYDESLSLTRSIGEIANLACLFVSDPSAMTTWTGASSRQERRQFGPGPVRTRLRNESGRVLIDDDRYRALCEIGTHPVPGFAPNHFSGTGRPTLGFVPEEAGVLMCLNELAYAVCSAALPLAKLLDIPPEREQEMLGRAKALVANLGSITVLNYAELLATAAEGREPEPEG